MDRSAETAIQTGASVFAEWLEATGTGATTPQHRLAAIAAFCGLCPNLGWAGNLRRSQHTKVAIRRGSHAWTYADLAASDGAWRIAAGERAHGTYAELVRVVADHILHADTRPDDSLVWRGDPADPWPFGTLIVGATLELMPVPPDQDAG